MTKISKKLLIGSVATVALGLSACSAASNAASDAASATKTAAADTVSAVKDVALKPAANIGDAPSGVYKSEAGHAYIAMSYNHQGYAKPILRWGAFDATVNVDSENPENSSLSVEIDVASIDSGVDVFDDHLRAEQFFNVAEYPTISFSSTDMKQLVQGRGQVTGELTIKDVTKPVTLDVTLNKVGQHFRSKKDMFGISATTMIRRDDFGVGLYDVVGQEVEIQIEVEFVKAE
ncbi:MAG: YceI family protein [Maricaulaceae bacterium]